MAVQRTVVVIVLVLAACSSPAPPIVPELTCEPPPPGRAARLQCGDAAAAALAALPLLHPPVARIEFRYGFACPEIGGIKCHLFTEDRGHVLIAYTGGQVVLVNVRLDDGGAPLADAPIDWEA